MRIEGYERRRGQEFAGFSCLSLGIKVGELSVAEGARVENPDAPETIGPDLVSSVRIQSLTEVSEVGVDPVKPDRTR